MTNPTKDDARAAVMSAADKVGYYVWRSKEPAMPAWDEFGAAIDAYGAACERAAVAEALTLVCKAADNASGGLEEAAREAHFMALKLLADVTAGSTARQER